MPSVPGSQAPTLRWSQPAIRATHQPAAATYSGPYTQANWRNSRHLIVLTPVADGIDPAPAELSPVARPPPSGNRVVRRCLTRFSRGIRGASGRDQPGVLRALD